MSNFENFSIDEQFMKFVSGNTFWLQSNALFMENLKKST